MSSYSLSKVDKPMEIETEIGKNETKDLISLKPLDILAI